MEEADRIREILDYYRGQRDRSEQSTAVEMLRELQEVRGFLTPELKKAAAETAGVSEKLIDCLLYTSFQSIRQRGGSQKHDHGGAAADQKGVDEDAQSLQKPFFGRMTDIRRCSRAGRRDHYRAKRAGIDHHSP